MARQAFGHRVQPAEGMQALRAEPDEYDSEPRCGYRGEQIGASLVRAKAALPRPQAEAAAYGAMPPV